MVRTLTADCLHDQVNRAIPDQFQFLLFVCLFTSVDSVNFLCTVIVNIFKSLCAKSFLPRIVSHGVYIVICFVVSGRLVGLCTLGLICFTFFGSEGFFIHNIFHRSFRFDILFIFIPYLLQPILLAGFSFRVRQVCCEI